VRSIHGERRLMGHERAVTAQRVVVVQLSHVSHVSPCVRPWEILRRLLALASLVLGKPPIRVFPLGRHEGCFDARAGHYAGGCGHPNRLVVSPQSLF
jgi:hypothetical protein